MKVKLEVKRSDPERYERYELPYEEGDTLLTALQKIKEEHDPSLSFRAFCRAGICGTCAVKVNGFPKLACREQLRPYALTGEVIKVEPLDGFPVIKDLVVETEGMVERAKNCELWVKPKQKNLPIPPEVNRKIEKGADCILCFACQSYCPQTREREYAGPLFFAKLHRFCHDPRDADAEKRLEEAFKGELYHCLSCDKCSSACPKEVSPADLIRELMTCKGLAQKS
ncbi:MAG: succinate dehydrogenase/fumarate reductase iron-sulfur subunit [Aquificae bacterium]|nr:succinate dehydrogenase/fumarate reductase iron-sulfur subunit [Aquificota bacterium]